MSRDHNIKIAGANYRLIKDQKNTIPKTIISKYRDVRVKSTPICGDTTVLFENLKTDDCARKYIQNETFQNVVIMNFASRHHPGGGYLRGAKAQEEALCRSIPQLYSSLKSVPYPFEEDTVLITPNVEIMRNSDNYDLLSTKNRVTVSVVSAAAPNLRHDRFDEGRIKRALINMYISVNKHLPRTDTLVLGAWGCGAFRNDPCVMAKIMDDINLEYGGLYKYIIFSVPDGQNTREFKDNIALF